MRLRRVRGYRGRRFGSIAGAGTVGGSGDGSPTNGYVAEDGSTFYVAEDGSTFYVQEA
jgi:hypothetical protein